MADLIDDFRLERRGSGWVLEGYEGSEKELSIPSHIDGAPVTLVAKEAFQGNPNLISLEIPETVTFIGNFAFASCTSLERVVLNASVTTLNLNTFSSCPALVDVSLPEGLVKLGDGTFRNCTALVTMEFPAALEEIGDSAFRDCTAFSSLVLGDNVKTIQRNAFRDCTALSTAVVPASLSYIGPRAFQGCSALESIAIAGSPIDDALTAFRNHSMTYLVADYALERDLLSFDEGRKLFDSKLPLEKVFAARIIARHTERLERFPMKKTLVKTLAAGGCVDELSLIANQTDLLAEPLVHDCIDAASEAGKTEAVAFLLDLLAANDSPAGSAFDGMKL